MNNYDKALDTLDLSPYRREWCCVCGQPKTDGHHVVYRSHGGKDKHIISLCRECHRLAHVARLRFKASADILWALESTCAISIDAALTRPPSRWLDLRRRSQFFAREWER